MAEKHNMGRMLFCILLIVNTRSVVSKFCLSEECSEPITSARIKVPYKTKDVHLYVGDEVDILSKSDDGSQMEFEIGDVKGIIPTDHLKESSLKIDQDSLIHVPEFLGEDDENGHSLYMDGDDPDDSEGEMEESPDDFMEEDMAKIQHQKKASDKVKKPNKIKAVPPKKNLNTDRNRDIVTNKNDIRSEEEQVQSKAKKMEEREQHRDATKDASATEQVIEALAPGSKGNDKTEQVDNKSGSIGDDKNSQGDNTEQNSNEPKNPLQEPVLMGHTGAQFHLAIRKLENYKIMKERYIQDYLDTHHGGKNVDEKVQKQVEEFIEGDMMEQLKEPDSDLLQMLLHYDPKDLPGKRIDKEDKENDAVGNESGSDAKSKEDKPPVMFERNVDKSVIVNSDAVSNQTVSVDGHQQERKVADDEKDVTNSNASMINETENVTETSPENADSTSAERSEKPTMEQPVVGGPFEHSDPHQAVLEEKKQDFTQHPNYPALRKKYVESYLSKHYKNEKVSSHIKLMVENLIGTDLLQQLQTDKAVREELFGLVPDTDHHEAVDLEKNVKEGVTTSTPGLGATQLPSEVTVSTSVQNDNVQMTASVDNVVHSTAVESIISEEFHEAKLESNEDKNHSQQPTNEGESAEKKIETGTGPIPPAGRKDSQKHISEDDSHREDGKGKENLFSNEDVDDKLSSAEEYIAKEKEDENIKDVSKNGNKDDLKEKHLDIDDEDVEHTAEEKSANNEESSNNFSFKRLGSVLKDRFKAFAKKIIANEEEGKASQDDKEPKSSDNSDLVENSDEIHSDSYQDPSVSKIDNAPDAEKEVGEVVDVPRASLFEDEIVTDSKIEPENENMQESADSSSSYRNEEVVNVNSLSAGTEDGEKKTAEEEIVKDDGMSAAAEHKEHKSEEEKIVNDEKKTEEEKIIKDDGLSAGTEHEEKKTEEEKIVKDDGLLAGAQHGEKKTVEEEIVKDDGMSPVTEHKEKKTEEEKIANDDGLSTGAENQEIKTDGEEILKDDGLLSGAEREEKKTEDSGTAKDDEIEKERQKSADIIKNSVSEDESRTVDHRNNLVSLTTIVPASGSDELPDGSPVSKEKNNPGVVPDGTSQPTGVEESAPVTDGVKESVVNGPPEGELANDSSDSQDSKGTDVVGNSFENLKSAQGHFDSNPHSHEKSSDIETADVPYKAEGKSSISDSSDSVSSDADANINVVSEKEASVEKLAESFSRRQFAPDENQYNIDDLMKMKISEEDSRDMLLEMCNSQPSLPECDKLRGAKIYRGKSQRTDTPEESSSDGDIGRLGRAWRNIVKLMKRIKLMKLGFVQLFHGPLSVMGLEDISHWIHEQIEHASPEVITITTCCLLLIFVLVMRSCFASKHVRVGASSYDVHKMRQSRQKILQENTEDMASELKRLQELIQSKDSEINQGDQSYKDLQSKLDSLQEKFDEQESLLETIRRELQDGKMQQKRLHEMMEEKEQEIQQADDMALRHQNEIERQNEISETLNDRLGKVVNELDLKDGIVLDLQEKNGALRIELENVEMERRKMEKEKNELAERCTELEEKFQLKEEENGKLQDEMDEKENEIEVLRDCMAQINNGKLDGEAVEDFDTPEEDPDIKEQLKTERLKQIVESTQALANLKKCEKEKEYFQEGYLEELEKREIAEKQVKNLKEEVEKLSKDVNTYKNSSTEYHIKLETLQHYFKQQETELHRKLSVEEQSRLDFQKKYQEIMGQSSSAIEETTTVKSQNEDLKNEIKEMERSIKEVKIAAEKETHELWIKNRQINRDLEEMKRERDIYRKRLLEAETAKKASASPQVASVEKLRDSPAGSDDGRPASPGSQKSAASGVPNYMIRPRAMFPPPPPPPMFPPMHMPVGPMAPPQLPPFGQMRPMMGRPQGNMPGPPGGVAGAPMPSSGQPLGPVTGAPTGPAGFPQPPHSVPSSQFNAVPPTSNFGAPTTSGFQSNPTMPPNYMEAPSSNQNIASQQPSSASPQTRPPMPRRDSQKSLTNGGGRQTQGQTTPVMQRRFQPQPSSTMQGPFQSTPINSPNMTQTSQLPPSHPSLVRTQTGQSGRTNLQNRTMSSDIA